MYYLMMISEYLWNVIFLIPLPKLLLCRGATFILCVHILGDHKEEEMVGIEGK